MNMSKEVENSLVPEGTLIRDPLLRPSSVRATTGIVTYLSPISKKKSYKQKLVADISSIFGGCGRKEALRSANRKYPHLNAKPSQPMGASKSRAAGVIMASEICRRSSSSNQSNNQIPGQLINYVLISAFQSA